MNAPLNPEEMAINENQEAKEMRGKNKTLRQIGMATVMAGILAVVGVTTKACQRSLNFIIDHATPHSAIDPKSLPPGFTPEPRKILVNSLTEEEWLEKAEEDAAFVMKNFRVFQGEDYSRKVLTRVLRQNPSIFFDRKYFSYEFQQSPDVQAALKNIPLESALRYYHQYSATYPSAEKIVEESIKNYGRDYKNSNVAKGRLAKIMFELINDPNIEKKPEYGFIIQCIKNCKIPYDRAFAYAINDHYSKFGTPTNHAEVLLDLALKQILDWQIEVINRQKNVTMGDEEEVHAVIDAFDVINMDIFDLLGERIKEKRYPQENARALFEYFKSQIDMEAATKASKALRGQWRIDLEKIEKELEITEEKRNVKVKPRK